MNREKGLTKTFRNDFMDLFDRFDFDMPFMHGDFAPKIEVKDLAKTYQISAEVPGMDEKDFNITLKDNQLILEGEKRDEYQDEDKKKGYYHSEFSYGKFYRAIPLAEDVDKDKITANYKNGVLYIDVAKIAGTQSKTRKIELTKH